MGFASKQLLATCAITITAMGIAVAEPATFEVEGNIAYMEGDLGEPTPGAIVRLFQRNPDVDTIVMEYVPGSEDDESNVRAAKMVHQRNITTAVPADGLISSGGVDFFLAGRTRIVQNGACVGVHSWSDDDQPRAPKDLPRDHPDHKVFLNYYNEIGISDEFYWFTLNAAPADGMHWMSTAEMLQYGVATEISDTPANELAMLQPCNER